MKEAGQRLLNHGAGACLVIRPGAGRLVEQRDPLACAAPDGEITGQRRRHRLDRLAIAQLDGVQPGSANVFELDVHRQQRRGLAHVVIADMSEAQRDVLAMASPRRRLIGHVAADALLHEGMQREATVVVRAQQRFVGESREHRQPHGSDLLGRRARERRREHRQLGQALLLERIEKPPRMLEARAHAALAIGRPPIAFEQIDRLLDLALDLRNRKHTNPRGREFDRERHTVEQTHQRSDVRRTAPDVESGRGGVRAQLEQLHGVEGANQLRFRFVDVRRRESSQRQQPFAAHRQAGARRHQQLDRCAGLRQPFDEGSQPAEVFGVIEDEQLLRPTVQRRGELLERIGRTRQ